MNLVFLTADVKHNRMFEVILRHRANAIGPEELVLVEHVGQHLLKLLLVEDRQQTSSFISREAVVGRSHVGNDLGMALAKQREHLRQLRITSDNIRLEYCSGA